MDKKLFEEWKKRLKEVYKETPNINTLDSYIIKLRSVADSGELLKNGINNYISQLHSANRENSIILEETRNRPASTVSLNKLPYSLEIEKLTKIFGVDLQNNKEGYIGNINFFQARKICQDLDGFMLNPELFIEFLKSLKSGKAFDGNGKKIDKNRLEKTLSEILKQEDPLRGEFLDCEFLKYDDLNLRYSKLIQGKIKEVTEKLSDDTLIESRNINLDDYLENPTLQCLPRKTTKEGNLNVLRPYKSGVVLFATCLDGNFLLYDANSEISSQNLGVRLATIYEK